jgi:hypothetical protein
MGLDFGNIEANWGDDYSGGGRALHDGQLELRYDGVCTNYDSHPNWHGN